MKADKLIYNKYRIAPLSGGYMMTSIIGFFISVFYIYPNSNPWGFTLGLFFAIMIVDSLISMTYSPTEWSFDKKKRNILK
tara:strand:+ start:134 stop:373 length:240 start_codon:yes stop_codon:yes gene_type:complete